MAGNLSRYPYHNLNHNMAPHMISPFKDNGQLSLAATVTTKTTAGMPGPDDVLD